MNGNVVSSAWICFDMGKLFLSDLFCGSFFTGFCKFEFVAAM